MNKVNVKIVLFLGVLGVSLSAILIKYSTAPSLVAATYRMFWTVVILVPLSLKKTMPELKTLKKKELRMCILAGVFFAFHFMFWFESLKHSSIASATFLVDTDVIFAALGFCLIMHGTIPKKGILAIAITICGGILIVFAGENSGNSSLYGNILAICAAVLIASYTLSGRFIRIRNISTTAFTLVAYTSCLTTLLVLDFVTGTPIWGYGIRELLIGLGLAVFCNLLGHSIVSWSLKYLTPGYVSAVKLCEPVFSTVLGIFCFREIPNLLQIIAAAIILAGVYLYSTVENAET